MTFSAFHYGVDAKMLQNNKPGIVIQSYSNPAFKWVHFASRLRFWVQFYMEFNNLVYLKFVASVNAPLKWLDCIFEQISAI